MFTSYYGNIKKVLEQGLRPVAISRGIPKWYKGEREIQLAPTWKMLKMPRAEYDRMFEQMLARLDPEELYQSLGDDAVLLCWEKPNDWCHRRLVAEWFENHLGIVVPELGYDRSEILPYRLCGIEQPQEKAEKKEEPEYIQGELFKW